MASQYKVGFGARQAIVAEDFKVIYDIAMPCWFAPPVMADLHHCSHRRASGHVLPLFL